MNKPTVAVYISGPITGVMDYAEKFREAKEKIKAVELEEINHAILNPATLPDGLSKREYMQIDLQMLSCADVMVLLPGWIDSEGCRIEKLYAQYIGGVQIYTMEEFMEKLKRISEKENGHV